LGARIGKFLPIKPWLLGAWATGRDIPQPNGAPYRKRQKKMK